MNWTRVSSLGVTILLLLLLRPEEISSPSMNEDEPTSNLLFSTIISSMFIEFLQLTVQKLGKGSS